MAMTAESAPGDPELMLTIIVEEFASIGMNSQEINRLFDDSFYGATGLLKRKLGEDRVRSRITEIVQHCGILRETVDE